MAAGKAANNDQPHLDLTLIFICIAIAIVNILFYLDILIHLWDKKYESDEGENVNGESDDNERERVEN